jgi:hypothetical protein
MRCWRVGSPSCFARSLLNLLPVMRADAHGLTVDITKGRGEERTVEKIWVAAPFEVLGRIRDPKGEGWARWLRWRDDDGRAHTQSISDADLHGDPRTLCAMLAGLGLKVGTGPNRANLLRYLNEAPVQSRVTIVARTGPTTAENGDPNENAKTWPIVLVATWV